MVSFSSFLLLVCASCGVSLATASSSVLSANPRCVKFKPIKLKGLSEFVDVENPLPYPTTGDMSIVTSFQPTSGLPITQPYFRIQDIEARATCIVTQDQVPNASAPSCFLEFELQFCYRNVAVEVEKDLVEGGLRRDLLDRIPVDCSRSTTGKFMATGTGPAKYAITGGTDGFFGAFGQITNDFDLSNLPTLGLETTIEMCFYANVSL